MAEIDDGRLRILEAAYALLDKMQSGPKTRAGFEKLVKEINPNAVTTGDLAEPYVTEVKSELGSLRKLVEERFKNDDEARQDRALSDAFTGLRKEGLTTEGEDAVKKLMVDRKIPDPEAAFALYRKLNPPPPPMPNAPGSNRWGTIEATKATTRELFENPAAWADAEAGKIIEEFRQQRAA